MKKFISILSLIAFSTMLIAQADTTIQSSAIKSYETGSRTWRFIMPIDTFDATGSSDTLIVNFDHIFSTPYVATVISTFDVIAGDAVGVFRLQEAPTSSGPWRTVGTVNVGFEDLAPDPVTMLIRNLYLRALYIGTVGEGSIRGWMTLKPSSINP